MGAPRPGTPNSTMTPEVIYFSIFQSICFVFVCEHRLRILKRIQRIQRSFFFRFVATDEIWIHYYIPEMKQQSIQ